MKEMDDEMTALQNCCCCCCYRNDVANLRVLFRSPTCLGPLEGIAPDRAKALTSMMRRLDLHRVTEKPSDEVRVTGAISTKAC